jgi:hypothetical protein
VAAATYVYCLIAASRRPPLSRVPRGLPKLGPVRLLDVGEGLFAAVADAPPDRCDPAAIKELADLARLSRAALAHEAVVESFTSASAVLPMKLFTVFTTDHRAVEHVRAKHRHIATVVKRVAEHQEWGVRVLLDRAPSGRSGIAYLALKKAQRDAGGALYDRLAIRARLARWRPASELPRQAASFQALAARECRALAHHGCRASFSGPWPPYSFMQD